jgi:hypothetical protein
MLWEIKQCININLLVVFSYFHLFSWILVGVLDIELRVFMLQVEVMWATDPLAQWREGVGLGANRDNGSSSSRLLRAEVPLSRHGRGNKLASAIVNPKSDNDGSSSALQVPFRGREIVAYDDIL